MGKKYYNPENLEMPEPENAKPAERSSNENERRYWYSGVVDTFTDPRARRVLGMALGFIGIYLLIVFISYFRTGVPDQSLVHSYGMKAINEANVDAENSGSIFGANIADMFLASGVGVAAFIIVLWCMVMGWRFGMMKKVHFFSYSIVTLISIVTCSLVVGALTLGQDILFFPLGGSLGEYTNIMLIHIAGYPGMVIVNAFLVGLWIFICLNTIKNLCKKVNNVMPKRTHFDEPQDDKNNFKKKKRAKKAVTEEVSNEIDATPEEPDPFDVPKPAVEIQESETQTQTSHKIANDNNDLGKIEVAPEIVQATSTTVEAFDPTAELSKFRFPSVDLLIDRPMNVNNVDIDEQEENKRRITETLNHYNISIKKIDVCVGPTITLFEIVPADGIRIAKIKNLEDDIALSLAALGIRIIAPIPGKGTIGIEVPNKDPQTVSMRSVIGSKKFQESKMELPMALGCTIENRVFMADLTKMPHLLVAGATGQGKSVGLNAIITSLLYKKHPSELKFVLIDPKMVEFSLYSKLEHHYLARIEGGDECVITESKKVVATLNSLVQEMEDRYLLLKEAQERNIKDYNRKFIGRKLNPEKGHRYLPYIVVIVDEFSDLIMTAGKDVERPIVRIAQKARAVGIHMIIATQRPSTDVITGIIKANFPGRIAFRVSQMVDSRTILDCSGAQQLVGKGDMLFQAAGSTERVQCAFVDTPEVEAVCECISEQVGYAEPYELPEYKGDPEEDGGQSGKGVSLNDRDSLFEEAAAFIVSSETASTSSLQRRYGIGYNRAGRIMDQMEAAGIVSPSQGGKPRKVLVDSIQLAAKLENKGA